MKIRELSGKNHHIGILGFGREGQAMLKALEQYAPDAAVTILDQNPNLSHSDYPVIAGPKYLDRLDQFDMLIKSPGIPPSAKLAAYSVKLTSPTQIFFDSIASSGATVIGVTGSKGKSTTASLIHHILKAHSSKLIAQSYLVGNIGEPAIAHLKDAVPGAIFVMEISSYQLMDLTVSPSIAVVTAFFPEHLDYHGSVEAYKEAKKHIARFQTKDDIVFFAADSEGASEIAEESPGKRIPFSAKDAPVTLAETKLIGAHNLSNIAAAFLVSQELKVPRKTAIEAIRSFTPLPHRLQSLGVRNGIEWVDDSISTTPESAIAALDALGDRVAAVILGGQDRGNDFSELGKRIARSAIRTVVLFPESGPRIGHAIEAAKADVDVYETHDMEEAVSLVNCRQSFPQSSPVVLLSPASPSYGMFKNFEERGEMFKKYIISTQRRR